MTKRTWTLLIIVALAAFTTVSLLAQPHPRPGVAGGPLGALARLGQVKVDLGLSDAQVGQIKSILTQLREQNEPYSTRLRENRGDVFDTLLENPANLASAQSALNEQTAAESAMRMNALNATAKALSVLTPEQRIKLSGMIAERRSNRRGR